MLNVVRSMLDVEKKGFEDPRGRGFKGSSEGQKDEGLFGFVEFVGFMWVLILFHSVFLSKRYPFIIGKRFHV